MSFPSIDPPAAAWRRRARRLAACVALAATLAACGSTDDDGDVTTGPTVADDRFDGRFELVDAVIDDDPGGGDNDEDASDEDSDDEDSDDGGSGEDAVEVPSGIVFEFDARFGALTVETPCGELLGSFSLLDDGRAGVSITGGRGDECSDEETEAGDALIGALARVEAWVDADDGFELRSAEERDRLLLAP